MSNSIHILIYALLVTTLALAAVTDMRTQRIPNKLTFPSILLGLALNWAAGGSHGLVFSLEGIGVASTTLILFLLVGGFGAGDVKLLWAVGALSGPVFTFWTIVGMALIGGVLGVAVAVRRGVFKETINNTLRGAVVFETVRSPQALKSMADLSKAGKMAYAPAIALGAAAAALFLHAGLMWV